MQFQPISYNIGFRMETLENHRVIVAVSLKRKLKAIRQREQCIAHPKSWLDICNGEAGRATKTMG